MTSDETRRLSLKLPSRSFPPLTGKCFRGPHVLLLCADAADSMKRFTFVHFVLLSFFSSASCGRSVAHLQNGSGRQTIAPPPPQALSSAALAGRIDRATRPFSASSFLAGVLARGDGLRVRLGLSRVQKGRSTSVAFSFESRDAPVLKPRASHCAAVAVAVAVARGSLVGEVVMISNVAGRKEERSAHACKRDKSSSGRCAPRLIACSSRPVFQKSTRVLLHREKAPQPTEATGKGKLVRTGVGGKLYSREKKERSISNKQSSTQATQEEALFQQTYTWHDLKANTNTHTHTQHISMPRNRHSSASVTNTKGGRR